MRPILDLALLGGLIALPAAPAGAQGPAPSHTVAGPVQPKAPLTLTDEQKKRVAQAINGQDTPATNRPEGPHQIEASLLDQTELSRVAVSGQRHGCPGQARA